MPNVMSSAKGRLRMDLVVTRANGKVEHFAVEPSGFTYDKSWSWPKKLLKRVVFYGKHLHHNR